MKRKKRELERIGKRKIARYTKKEIKTASTSNPEANEAENDVEKKVEVASALQEDRHGREEERHKGQEDVHEGQSAGLLAILALVLLIFSIGRFVDYNINVKRARKDLYFLSLM